ncbi:MAG: sugar phosphate isomerase/epimerase [Spirochaetales bacterium]|nr:sugar phosphate isomerase/epimerase [Spirochaetales bacterium]
MDKLKPVIGINIPSSIHSLEGLTKKLSEIYAAGFQAAELRLDSFPLIIGGEVCQPWLKKLKEIFLSSPLILSTHIGRGLDLRVEENHSLHEQVLESSINICKSLGSSTLVIHYEEESKNNRVENLFMESLLKGAHLAANENVVLCIENIEVERVQPVINIVKEIDHPNLKMNFDTGHAFIASKYFDFNFLESLEKALPYLGHLHLSDNTGVFEESRLTDRTTHDTLPLGYRFEFGRGDIHLPPFWGKIPFSEVFKQLKDYNNLLICEYNSERFIPFASDIQEQIRSEVIKHQS